MVAESGLAVENCRDLLETDTIRGAVANKPNWDLEMYDHLGNRVNMAIYERFAAARAIVRRVFV